MDTLYITDLDGTLLNRKAQVSAKSTEIINRLVDKGLHFSYATARAWHSSQAVAGGLHWRLPVVLYNGCITMDPLTRKFSDFICFQQEEQAYISGLLKRFRITPLVYTYVGGVERVLWLPEEENAGMQDYFRRRSGDPRLMPVAAFEELFQGDIFYYTCIGEREALLPLYQALQADGRFISSLKQELYRPESWCEIMPGQVSKAHAVQRLKERLGVRRIVAFGDESNDIPLFQIADEAYAVANAVPELKACATGVIGSNEEDAVARWLLENAGF